MPATMPTEIDGMTELLDRYDRFIVDVWGTLYDGGAAFPGAVDALTTIRRAGGRVVILSNSPRVPAIVEERLAGIGIGSDLYDAVVTSGGEVRAALEARAAAPFSSLGTRVLQTGPTRFPDTLPASGYDSVGAVEDADWVLASGPEGEDDTLDLYEDMLGGARERGLPMICANPDRVVVHGGVRRLCAGALSDRYTALGGTCHEVGKPHAPILRRCLELLDEIDGTKSRPGSPLGSRPGPEEESGGGVLVVGDNLDTDIRGANSAGLASLWLTGGVHGEEIASFETLSRGVDALLSRHGAQAQFRATTFRP